MCVWGAGVMEWRRAETVGFWSPGKQDKIRPLYTERCHKAEHGGTRHRREKAIFGHFSPILVDAIWRRGEETGWQTEPRPLTYGRS